MARRPQRPSPEPPDLDAVPVVVGGTALWALVGIGLLLFARDWVTDGHEWLLWTCAAGVFLGLLGVRYCLRAQAAIARDRAAAGSAERDATLP